MAKGRVTPQGKKVVQSELNSAQSAQKAPESHTAQESVIDRVENNNMLSELSDSKNDHSESETVMQSALNTTERAYIEQVELAEARVIAAAGHYSPYSATSAQDALQSTLESSTTMTHVENKSSSSLTTDTKNAHSCDTPGCIAHSTREIEVGTDTFQFRVHFTPITMNKVGALSAQESILWHATESVSRKVAHLIRTSRKDNKGDGFPSGRIVDIDTSCNFARTLEDEKNEIRAMTQEQRDKYLAELMRKIDMAKALQKLVEYPSEVI